MNSKMIWANFSVKDAARTHRFYTELGFKSNGSLKDPKLASFFFGENNFVIHFFEEGSRIDDYLGNRTGSEIIFTLSAASEAEVKEWEELVQKAGGAVFQEAGRDELGYYGLGFTDPDGHKFNVLLMDKM